MERRLSSFSQKGFLFDPVKEFRKLLVRLNWVGDDQHVYSRVFIHKHKNITNSIEGLSGLIVPDTKHHKRMAAH
jgi:hypothetical protein